MDQAGDTSTGFNAPTGVTPDPSIGAQPMFGPAPSASTFAASGGGGGAMSAPITPVTSQVLPGSVPPSSSPSSSPAGFDVSSNAATDFNMQGPGGILTAQNVLNAPDPNAPTGAAAGGGAAGAGAAGGAPAGSNSILNAIRNPGMDSILNAVGSNLGPLAGLGVLGFEAANRPAAKTQELAATAQPRDTSAALAQQAGTLQTAGQTLSQPLATGVLPPGAQASIDQVTQQQEAQIRQQFASMGLTGSTMEAEAIAQARQGAQARGFALAQQMAQQGLADMNLSSSIFGNLLTQGLQQDSGFEDALSKFAQAAAGGGGTTIKVGG